MIRFPAMYTFGYSNLIDPILRDVRVRAVELAGMKLGDRVLDVCCGTGAQVLHYAARGVAAAGIDVDPRMIGMAGRRRRGQRRDSVSLAIADAGRLPFRDGAFDCASISFALHEKESPARDRVVSEMRRVVRPEGVLLFIDFAAPQPGNVYALLVRVVEFLAGREHFRCSRDFIRQGGLDELLERNGLREERRDYLKYGTVVAVKVVNA